MINIYLVGILLANKLQEYKYYINTLLKKNARSLYFYNYYKFFVIIISVKLL